MHKRFVAAFTVALCMLAVGASAAAAAAPKTFFGISAVRPDASDYKGMSDKVGAGSVRIEIAWPGLQPSKGADYLWGGVDQRFRQAATFGLRPQPVVFGTPEWLSGDGTVVSPPTHSKKAGRQWQKLLRAASERYGPGGDFWAGNPTLDENLAPKNWIIWNEQNARAYWHPKASPSKYAKLLRLSRSAFDDVDPKINITVGGMFGYPEHSKSIPAKRFIQQLYRKKGTRKAIDAISLHPYGSNVKQVKKQVKQARRAMDRSGDKRAKILIGEIGWASGGKKDYFLIKNKKSQARLLKQSYNYLLNKRKAYDIVGAYWFTYRDYGGEAVCVWCPRAGLLNKKGKLKPAGKAYKKLSARAGG